MYVLLAATFFSTALMALRSVTNKFAVYHVPMYPSARSFSNVDSTRLRQYWEPLFSQCVSSYHIVTCIALYVLW